MHAPSSDQTIWSQFRQQMPVTQKWAYFDHAAVAPITAAAQTALVEWATAASQDGEHAWMSWHERAEQTRTLGAELLGAKLSEMAFVHNTTEGINFVAQGFPWKTGDNIVTLAGEFPTNYVPWRELQSQGVELRVLEPGPVGHVTLEQIAAALDERTRLVTLSWVNYITGWRNDLAAISEIVHRNKTLLLVDAIQGLGVIPIDVHQMGIDFLAADGHKWMLGPEGAGFFFIKEEHLNLLKPLTLGWNSLQDTWKYDIPDRPLKQTAARYEGGTANFGLLTALGASLKLLTDLGIKKLEKRLLELNQTLAEELREIGAEIISPLQNEHASGILSLHFPGVNPKRLFKQCQTQGVLLNSRGGYLRISPHVYTNEDDLQRLIEAIKSFVIA